MKNKNTRTVLITTLLCLLPIVFSISVYNQLPQQIPIHWNFSGEVDGYAPKIVATIGLPCLLACINVICHIVVNNDPKKQNVSKRMKSIVLWLIPAMSIFLNTITILISLGMDIHIHVIVPILIGIIIIVIGNYLPKCKQNYSMGIRIPWTLADEVNWNKTHRVAGFIYVLAGFIMIVNTLFLLVDWLTMMLCIITSLTILPMLYSFYLYKKAKN